MENCPLHVQQDKIIIRFHSFKLRCNDCLLHFSFYLKKISMANYKNFFGQFVQFINTEDATLAQQLINPNAKFYVPG